MLILVVKYFTCNYKGALERGSFSSLSAKIMFWFSPFEFTLIFLMAIFHSKFVSDLRFAAILLLVISFLPLTECNILPLSTC